MAQIKGYSSPTRGPVTGDTLGFNATTAILVREVGSSIFYLDPSAAPFTLLTDRSGSEVTSEPRFEWYEKTLRPKTDTLEGTGSDVDGSTSTTVLVTDGSDILQVGDLVLNIQRAEIYLVNGRTNATSFTVVRGAAGSTAVTTALDGDNLTVIGSAYAEGVDTPAVDEWQEVHKFNFTQIFRRSFGASRTRESAKTYFGATRPKLTGEKTVEHAMDIERMFLSGGRSETEADGAGAPTVGGGVLRTTGGFTYWATQNVLDLSGVPLSEPDLEGWLEDVFAHVASTDSRTLFAAPQVITAFDMIAVNKIQTVSDPSLTYGIKVSQYRTAHGMLNIVKHRLLPDIGYDDGAFAVDVKKLRMRPLAGGQTKLLRNRQSPGVDGWVDEYLSEVGLQFANAEVHGILKNVGAFV